MSTPARLMAYPLVMLSGAVIGGTFLSVHSPFNQAEASMRPQQSPEPAPPPFRGRLGAETPELHELRMAEAEMFPKGYDRDLSAPELWDQSGSGAGDSSRFNRSPLRDPRGIVGGLAATPDFLRGLTLPDIPVQRDRTVAKYIRFFTSTSNGRKMLTTWIRRSGRYHQLIAKALRKHQVPSDIESVVYIESGFWPTARSTAGAVGLWQFMPKTARVYGLTVDRSVDERRSIWKATDAAATYLSDLYERLHSWDLALAAFNMGYNRLSNVISQQGTDNYWALRSIDGALPRETSLYVPKVLAISVIIHNLKHFDLGGIQPAPPLDAARIRVPPGIRLSLLARAAGTSLRELRMFNPEIRIDTTPDRGGPVTIHIPAKGLARARVMLPRLLADQGDTLDMKVSPDFDWGSDEGVNKNGQGRLERGSAGNGLDIPKASGTGTAARAQAQTGGTPGSGTPTKTPPDSDTVWPANDFSNLGGPAAALDKTAPAKTGSIAPLAEAKPSSIDAKEADPIAPDPASLMCVAPARVAPVSRGLEATRMVYRVQPGDNAWSLSQVWGVPLARLVKENHLKDPNVLPIGRVLKLDIPPFRKKAPTKPGK